MSLRQDTINLPEKAPLILRVNFFTALSTLLMALFCYFVLDTGPVITFTFFLYSTLLTGITLRYRSGGTPSMTIRLTTLITLLGAMLITLFSGGIQSPFIFVFSLMVFGAYLYTRKWGKHLLYLITVFILVTYSTDRLGYTIPNQVPRDSASAFSLLSILFSLYLLGSIFGKNILGQFQHLTRSRVKLQQKNKQKDILLKEIHHRVKNNLQTVSSLLSLQSRNVEDQHTREILKNSQQRVISMALIHEMLYAYDDISRIKYQEYVEQLASNLIRSIKGADNNIELKVSMPEVKLDMATAVPLGLLINEFVTNTLKHGIQGDSAGKITILLHRDNDGQYLLQLKDTGIGFNESKVSGKTNSLGLRLINNLVRQLRGSMEKMPSDYGVHFLVRFNEAIRKKPRPSI